jgi:hypothetical protein
MDEMNGEAEYLFLRSQSAATNALWWLLGGLAAVAAAIAGFLVAVFTQTGQLSLHLMSTMPMLIGLGALMTAWVLARTPRQVTVSGEGLSIEGAREIRRFSWGEIGWVAVGETPLSNRRQLVVYDTAGKTLAKVSEAFDDFDMLADLVVQQIGEKPDDTSERIRTQKAKRSALFAGGIGVVMLVVSTSVAWMTHREQRAARLLNEAGVKGEAEIVRWFLAPNGVTPRLEYSITTADGRTATRNAEVERAFWDGLEGATRVPVVYVPDEPAISRLEVGEPEGQDPLDTPLGAYGLAAGGAVLCLVLLGGAVLQWHGWDIGMDPKTRKFSIKRYGAAG